MYIYIHTFVKRREFHIIRYDKQNKKIKSSKNKQFLPI